MVQNLVKQLKNNHLLIDMVMFLYKSFDKGFNDLKTNDNLQKYFKMGR